MILMHGSAASNISRKFCDKLPWGEVNCDLKPCQFRIQIDIFYYIYMKDLNIISFYNK